MSIASCTSPFKVIGTTALSAMLLLAPLVSSAEDQPSPLRSYLAAKREAIQAQSAKPGAPTAIHAKVTAESRSGVRRLRIGPTGEFQYISDSGRNYAGYNLGAGSWDSLVGTLASAVAD
jgi:hypothetical protein